MSASVGTGRLRRDRSEPQLYAGTATVAGFPYVIRATVEADAQGRYFALSFAAAPIPPDLRIPLIDDEAPG